MKVIKPVTIGAAQLVSSNIAEDEYAAWSAATDYAVSARIISNGAIYESMITPNVNKPPATEPLYWAKIGPSNRWAMFDSEISTQTEAAGEIEVVIKPGYVTGLALFGLSGSNLAITVQDGLGGEVVYSADKSLDGSVIEDWFQYFFEAIDQLEEVVFSDLPPHYNAHITVSITGLSAKCGILAVGSVHEIGRTQRGVNVGIIDYSRKETSAAGATTFAKRKFSKRMSAPLVIENSSLNKMQRILASLRATPCAWIGTDVDGYQPLTLFGFYRDFSIAIEYSNYSLCGLEIEGLT